MNYMIEAINEAKNGIYNGDGGPFGAVIVKDNKIIGKGHNKVLLNNDPTAHGEISAIREACNYLNTFDLSPNILRHISIIFLTVSSLRIIIFKSTIGSKVSTTLIWTNSSRNPFNSIWLSSPGKRNL